MLFTELIQMIVKILRNCVRQFSHTRVTMAANRIKLEPKEHLVWVDLEMSGLDIEKEHILEFACIVTDQQLNVIAESGLTKSVRESKISLLQAEQLALDFVKQHTPARKCPLAGNSVHADKVFLDKFMPNFMEHLHYRIVDVSTVKELCRALDDIRESIEELRYYRQAIFKEKEPDTSEGEETTEDQPTDTTKNR